MNEPTTILITCEVDLTDHLKREVEALGYEVTSASRTGLELEGTFEDTMRLNLHLRSAYNVLLLLKAFPCASPDEMYKRLYAFPWEEWIAPDEYLTVGSRVDTPSINNSMFASVKCKDAVVDRIQAYRGFRPDAGPDRRGVVLQLYWRGDKFRLFLNTSGRKVSDRGYRRHPHSAPLRECLAAAMLETIGYDGSRPLVNPMCGSGTLAIEAALIALGRAPGLLRDDFGFCHTLHHNQERWQAMRKEARREGRKDLPHPILATDHDPRAVGCARKNAQIAGVDQHIRFEVCDFADTPLPDTPGWILVNPEYGERLGEIHELEETYGRLGDWLKQNASGWIAGIFTGNRDLARRVGLRPRRKHVFWNAKIECRLFEYELYAGSRR